MNYAYRWIIHRRVIPMWIIHRLIIHRWIIHMWIIHRWIIHRWIIRIYDLYIATGYLQATLPYNAMSMAKHLQKLLCDNRNLKAEIQLSLIDWVKTDTVRKMADHGHQMATCYMLTYTYLIGRLITTVNLIAVHQLSIKLRLNIDRWCALDTNSN